MMATVGGKKVGGSRFGLRRDKQVGGRARLIFGAMLAALIAISMSGCATVLSGTRQNIDIDSEQEGAEVVINNIRGNKVFESKSLPETAHLKRGAGYFKASEYVVKISKEGGDTLTATIESKVNLIPYLGNIYSGGLIGMVLVDPATGAMWELDAEVLVADFDEGVIKRYPRKDVYYSGRYVLPLSGIPWFNMRLEYGWVWNSGLFYGTEFSFGYLSYGDLNDQTKKEAGYNGIIGGGLNLGGTYDLPVENLKLVYGGAAGVWYVCEYEMGKVPDRYGSNLGPWKGYDNYNFLAPFVGLRWKNFEISYRGLVGLYDEIKENLVDDQYGNLRDGDTDRKSGFGWNHHQISLGYYFEENKRWKPKKD